MTTPEINLRNVVVPLSAERLANYRRWLNDPLSSKTMEKTGVSCLIATIDARDAEIATLTRQRDAWKQAHQWQRRLRIEGEDALFVDHPGEPR